MAESMKGLKRTHYCNDIRKEQVGQTVTVTGWVQRQRDKGTLIFVDLRDRSGIVQLTFDDTTPRDVFEKAKSLRSEYVVAAVGKVVAREAVNPELPTGEIEIYVSELRILSAAATPPFPPHRRQQSQRRDPFDLPLSGPAPCRIAAESETSP